jgi:hypothetical protein
MSNGYFLADTNSIVYAYRAGGRELLDTYLDVAIEQDRKFAITERVLGEIDDGPLKRELIQYIADRNIKILPNPLTQQLIESGKISPVSAGEASILEVANRESELGRVTRIWADDKYFDSEQIMRKHPDVHRTMSAALLDEAYDQRFIGEADHQRFRAGYVAQPVFIDSDRLNSFRYDFSSPEIYAPRGVLTPTGAGRALGVAGLALEVYDGADSIRTANRLSREGNQTAAESELTHFGARSVGGWTGAGIGMAGGALLGVETGPGLLVTGAIGGVAGVFAGDKFAEWTDNRRIYNQELGGNTWTYDPENPALGWRREAPIDRTDDNIDNARRGDLRASPATENQLNYQATSVSVELVLGGPPPQRNPFSLPAEAGDTPSSRPTNWERDPETGTWQREVYGPFVERGMTPYTTDTADGERAARLDRQAAAIVVENAANSPASIAARYEDTYIRNGWQAHGEMPDAVRNARTNIDTLVASDGDLYQRLANGRWASDGMILDSTASGRLHDELEATRTVLEARLPLPRDIPPAPQMDADARLRDTLAGAYRNAGVEANDAQIATAATAVRATWEANGLDPSTTALQVKPQADGRYGMESPIASLRLDADGKTYVIAAETTPADIARAQSNTSPPPQPVERAPEQERDAPMRDQASARVPQAEQIAIASTALRLPDPRDPSHPDHRLYTQIERGVAGIDAERGRTFDATSERLVMSALHDAKAAGITSADHVAINRTGKPQQDGTQVAGGTLLFVVQGHDASDPAARRAATDVAQAVERPVEQSLQRADALAQQQAQVLAQVTNQPVQDEANRASRMV